MAEFLSKLGDVLTDLSPGVVVGSLMIALTLALVGSGIHALAWGRKGPTPIAPVCGLMFAISVISMAIAAGYVRPSRPDSHGRPGRLGHPPHAIPRGRAILDAGDLDQDGYLTPREAFELVRRADTSRRGSADLFDLDHVNLPDPSAPSMADELADAARKPPVLACFPPTGGATGHDNWPLISRHPGPPRPPKL